MTHRAFVLGCNGLPGDGLLEWAVSDGNQISALLKTPRCSYVVTKPSRSIDKWAKFRQFETSVNECAPGDTFLLYFAGHGILDGGKLHLVWQESGKDELQAAIPVEFVLNKVQGCAAANRLVVLDCCHAGAAGVFRSAMGEPVEEVAAHAPDNFLVLMGSKRVEKVREFVDFRGTFLSARLRDALGVRFDEADADKDRRLSFADLATWLSSSWAALPEVRRGQVPEPHHFGNHAGGELYLTPRFADWTPVILSWPNATKMVVLPIQPRNQRALCIGRFTVTNDQYRAFCTATGRAEPKGRFFPGEGDRFDLNSWYPDFRPWQDDCFNGGQQPVVCVDFNDAKAYASWTSGALNTVKAKAVATLPTPKLWQAAAYGKEGDPQTPETWLGRARIVHHRAERPLTSDDSDGSRLNPAGASDMIGNVWEWCRYVDSKDVPRVAASSYSPVYVREQRDTLHGGGFLDDLTLTKPLLESSSTGGPSTSHFDIGFRLAGSVNVATLSARTRELLSLQPSASDALWAEMSEATRHE